MKALLQSEVELWNIAAIAEIAVWERRPELQHLCAVVPERGTLGPGEVDRVLPGLSDAARRNIVRHLSYLRLIDDRGELTLLGRRCAATGQAPAWELGGYYFLVAVHPLFRCHVIDFQRAPADGKDWNFNSTESVPAWFRPDPDRVWTSAFDGTLKFTLQRLPSPHGADPRWRASKLPPAKLVWKIHLESGENTWHIEGELEGPRAFRSQPESVLPQKLTSLFAAWDDRWNPGTRRVAMAYDGTAAAGRDSFIRSFRYPEVKAGELGTFSDVVVDGVPVGPGSAAESRSWAIALGIARIAAADVYCSKDAWATEWDAVVHGTPLDPDAGKVLAPDAVGDLGGKPLPVRTRWLLCAPSDLAME